MTRPRQPLRSIQLNPTEEEIAALDRMINHLYDFWDTIADPDPSLTFTMRNRLATERIVFQSALQRYIGLLEQEWARVGR